MSGLIDPTMLVLTHALDGLTTRQSLISSNLANLDTPGYNPQGIDFESALANEVASMDGSQSFALAPSSGPSADVAMKVTDPRHISSGGLAASFNGSSAVAFNENLRNDQNTVDLESEMTSLTETQLKFSADSRFIQGKFSQLTTVLGGR